MHSDASGSAAMRLRMGARRLAPTLALALALAAGCAGIAHAAPGSSGNGGTGSATNSLSPDPVTRSQWVATLRWPTTLCPAAAPRPDAVGVEVQRIDAQRSWVIVDCEQWAYQGTQLVYLRTPQASTLLSFEQFDAQRPGALKRYRSSLLTGSIDFDAEHAVLRVLRLYRGLGDCGQWLRYEAGAELPRLTALRTRECGDTPGPELPPERWPLRRR